MQPSWAVVATVDEPAVLVAIFAAHHLAAGACEVHIFLDHPDPEAEALLARLPACHVTVCDAAYWAGAPGGRRPKLHPGRQAYNAGVVYDRTKADWLLHCDADEFVRDGAAVASALVQVPAQAMYLRLLVAERAHLSGAPETDIFAGVFRHAMPGFDQIGPDIYGPVCGFFREGITGHKAGKALVRTRAGLVMALHAPKGKQPHRVIQTTRLLHFDGLTRLHYMIKLLRRAYEPKGPASERHGASRITQFEALRESMGDPAHRRALVAMLKELTPAQMAQLRRLGALNEQRFDPTATVAAAGLTLDWSGASFDAALRQRYAGFLAEVAPDLLQG